MNKWAWTLYYIIGYLSIIIISGLASMQVYHLFGSQAQWVFAFLCLPIGFVWGAGVSAVKWMLQSGTLTSRR